MKVLDIEKERMIENQARRSSGDRAASARPERFRIQQIAEASEGSSDRGADAARCRAETSPRRARRSRQGLGKPRRCAPRLGGSRGHLAKGQAEADP